MDERPLFVVLKLLLNNMPLTSSEKEKECGEFFELLILLMDEYFLPHTKEDPSTIFNQTQFNELT